MVSPTSSSRLTYLPRLKFLELFSIFVFLFCVSVKVRYSVTRLGYF